MRALLAKPLTHFLVLGGLLFAVDAWLQWRDSYRIPAPTQADVDQRLAEWVKQTRLPVDAATRQQAYEAQLTDAILFQEALRQQLHLKDPLVIQRLLRDADFLGIPGTDSEKLERAYQLRLYEGDEVIRRQLIQRVEEIGRHQLGSSSEPSEAELKQVYRKHSPRWQREQRITLEHIFFSTDQGEPQARAHRAKADLQADNTISGDPFLQGFKFMVETPAELDRRMGHGFANAVLEAYQIASNNEDGTEQWLGPIPSAFGQHLVKVHEVQSAYHQSYESVRQEVKELWRQERERAALSAYIEKLKARYQVVSL